MYVETESNSDTLRSENSPCSVNVVVDVSW